MASHPLLEARDIHKSFAHTDRQDIKVLADCSVQIAQGEIVALLGKTGSGKSTLLRIMAGLIPPTSGDIVCNNQVVTGTTPGVSMVFQDFALFPWLTVLQNVELGLEAIGMNRSERRHKALKAIDIVGMDGFESAYPKELSGGMCQRVGFARALVVEPSLMLMDEPFSALDVLTAENLRSDLLDLWLNKKTKMQGMFIVTHNIEEAALLANRILVFDANPGRVKDEIINALPYPREEHTQAFKDIVEQVYQSIAQQHAAQSSTSAMKTINLHYRLPAVTISELSGLLETLMSPEYDKRVDLPELAEELHLDVDDLFQLTEMLEILRLAKVNEGDIELTAIGKMFAQADILDRKNIFAKQLLTHVPLVQHIRSALDQQPEHRMAEDVFLEMLAIHLSEEAAKEVLTTVIDWGRYAELFAYHVNGGMLTLDNPE